MRKAGIIIIAGIGIVIVTACSGAPGSPADACNQAMASVCNKIYSCIDTQTIQTTLGYTSQSDCTIKLQAQYNCANLTCPQGKTYNSTNASTCINDINTEACNQMANVPTPCLNTCQ